MNKIIKKIPYNIKLHIVYKFNFNYLFVFGWIGFIKYRLKKSIVFSVKQLKLKLLGIRNIYYTYLKLLNNFYSWTSTINKKFISLNGVGFKFKLHENRLFLILGFSHLVKLYFCKGVKLDLINNKNLALYSIDLLVLNRYSYILKKCKSLDVYKGKGILVEGEKVIKKEGKKALY